MGHFHNSNKKFCAGIFKLSMGARNRGRIVPARQATQPGGMCSLESILRLLQSLKIRALVIFSYSRSIFGGRLQAIFHCKLHSTVPIQNTGIQNFLDDVRRNSTGSLALYLRIVMQLSTVCIFAAEFGTVQCDRFG